MKLKVLVLLAGSLSLAACGGGGDSTPPVSSSSSSTSSVSSSSSSASSDGWELVWSDEFDGDAIDTDKWGFEVNCAGGGNNELQCYTAREENATVSDGVLRIVAREEAWAGSPYFDDDPAHDLEDTSAERDYTSARLRSKNKGDWRYGRVEIRAKMPQGQGIWPALWMLPTDNVYGGWPQSGEIDIFEAVNSNVNGMNEVHGTLHYGFPWPDNRYSGTSTIPDSPIWEEFHTYAVEWEEGAIHWFVDDQHFATQTSDGWFNYYWDDETRGYKIGEGAAPFDQRFHLIMNIAVGGNWPGSPDGTTQFPQTMEVDYVRVYECSADPDTGKGCSDNLDPAVDPLPGNPAPAQEEFPLYDEDGVASLMVDGPEGELAYNLTADAWQASEGNVVVNPANDHEDGTTWHAQFFGQGNIFLAVEAPASDLVQPGLKLTNMSRYGEIRFDILVQSKDENAAIDIKLDSGWPNVSQARIDPPVGEWTRLSVPIAELQANTVEPGQVDLDRVLIPFVLEVSDGAADIHLRNIVLRCPADCGLDPVLAGQSAVIEPPHTVFDDVIDVNWDFGIGIYEATSDYITASMVDADDASRGKVLDIQYGPDGAYGLVFIQSTSTKDMSAFAGGELSFDVRVLDYADAGSLNVRADCVHPCSSGDINIGMPGVGEWETVTLSVDLLTKDDGLDLTRVNTPFVVFPTWSYGAQNNVHLQVDNIRYLAP